MRGAARLLDLAWVTVPAGSPLIDKSLRELDIRRQWGVSVVGVLREGKLNPNPPGSFRFAAGDAAAVIGAHEHIAVFQKSAQPDPESIPVGPNRDHSVEAELV